MTPLEIVSTTVGLALALAALGALFARLVVLPYLKEQLVTPLLTRLDAMHEKDAELETASRIAAYMFEGHMEASEKDRGRLWEAVAELRRDLHHHDHDTRE